MRKIFFLLLCCMSASAVLAQSYKLVINKTDGQTLELNTSDVKDIQVVAADGTRSLTVSDLSNSGCIDRARAEQNTVPTIILKKEDGGIVNVELLNYYAQCAVTGFEVEAAVGHDGTMVNVDLEEVAVAYADCTCPYNISFMLHGLTANSFHLTCWWFSGEVSFEETDEVRLERNMRFATVDGVEYRLFTSTRQAVFWRCNREQGSEVVVPSVVTVDGEDYVVTALVETACGNFPTLTRVVLPPTLSGIFSQSGEARAKVNPFARCSALTDIVVEEGNSWFKVVDGMLMSSDGSVLYSFPGGDKRTSYAIPEGVRQLAKAAFLGCTQVETLTMPITLTAVGDAAFQEATGLRTLDFPESTKELGTTLFYNCKLERLIFRALFDNPDKIWRTFFMQDKAAVLYVQPSMVEVFKQVYGGTVLSLEELK